MSKLVKISTFDPNASNDAPFATFAEQRKSPQFKVHQSRATALRAFAMFYDCAAIYQWDHRSRLWQEIARKDLETHGAICDVCGDSMWELLPLTTVYYYRGRYVDHKAQRVNTGTYEWMRSMWGKKLIDPLQLLCVCKTCYQSQRYCV